MRLLITIHIENDEEIGTAEEIITLESDASDGFSSLDSCDLKQIIKILHAKIVGKNNGKCTCQKKCVDCQRTKRGVGLRLVAIRGFFGTIRIPGKIFLVKSGSRNVVKKLFLRSG